MKFLKNFSLGLLWAFLSPLLLAALAIWSVYALVVYFVEGSICIVRFFKGKSFFPPLEEDVMVEKIKKKELDDLIGAKEEAAAPAPQPQPQNVYVQTNYYVHPGAPIPGVPPMAGTPLPGASPLPGSTPLPGASPIPEAIPVAPAAPAIETGIIPPEETEPSPADFGTSSFDYDPETGRLVQKTEDEGIDELLEGVELPKEGEE